MNFSQAVRSVLKENYGNFKGRASVAEFWWWILFVFLVNAIFSAVFVLAGGNQWFYAVMEATANGTEPVRMGGFLKFWLIIWVLTYFAFLIPNLAVTTRRVHDRGMSGWWVVGIYVASLVPILNFVALVTGLVICAMQGDEGDNAYGPKPAG